MGRPPGTQAEQIPNYGRTAGKKRGLGTGDWVFRSVGGIDCDAGPQPGWRRGPALLRFWLTSASSTFFRVSESRFAAEHVVVVLSEAMRFIAHILQQSQAKGMSTEFDRVGLTGNKDFLVAFGEGDGDRGLDTQQLKGFHDGIELSLTAVDKEQIREGIAFV